MVFVSALMVVPLDQVILVVAVHMKIQLISFLVRSIVAMARIAHHVIVVHVLDVLHLVVHFQIAQIATVHHVVNHTKT